MQSTRRTEAGWEHQRVATLRQCGSGGDSSHGRRCCEFDCSTAASVGYEERLVPHRRGGGGGVKGGGAPLYAGRSETSDWRWLDARCDVTDARCAQLTSVRRGGEGPPGPPTQEIMSCNMCLEVGERGAHSSSLTVTSSGFCLVQNNVPRGLTFATTT